METEGRMVGQRWWEGDGELFNAYRASVLQNGKNSWGWSRNNTIVLNTTEIYTRKWLRWYILWVFYHSENILLKQWKTTNVGEELVIMGGYVRRSEEKTAHTAVCRVRSQLCAWHQELGTKTWRPYTKMLTITGDFYYFLKTFYSFQVLTMDLYFFYCREKVLF